VVLEGAGQALDRHSAVPEGEKDFRARSPGPAHDHGGLVTPALHRLRMAAASNQTPHWYTDHETVVKQPPGCRR